MKRTIKWMRIIVLSLALAVGFSKESSILADAPYRTFTFDGWNDLVETQTAYLPVGSIRLMDEERLSEASDLVIIDDRLYIADTGNQRILIADLAGNLIETLGEGVLSVPRGIFVTADHHVFVADEGHERVYVFSDEGELVREYSRPDHPLFGDTATFIPQKVVVDPRENLYIISQGNTNGIIQLSSANDGEFLGYFGVNRARISLAGMFRELIFNEEQRSQLFPTVPATTTNLDIDARGLIHTVTSGDSVEMLKKLNMAGVDLLGMTPSMEDPVDVLVGPYGNIFVVNASGFIMEFTSEGECLFIFGGQDTGDQRVGLFDTVTSIAIDSQQHLYVLDGQKNEIQIFEPTEFTRLVHQALIYYQEGRYLESKEPWEQVIEMNSLFEFAYVGLGEALFKEEAYDEALIAFERGLSWMGYSDSFWEVRNEWLRAHLHSIFLGIIGTVVAFQMIKVANRKKNILKPVKAGVQAVKKVKLIQELSFIWTFIKRPVDGYYRIKYEKKVSVLSTTILLGLFVVIYTVNRFHSGFLFTHIPDGQFNLGADLTFILGAFTLLLSSHYLVATITEGEGKFRQVYSGVVYSLAPYFILVPLATILSNFLTYNEIFILQFTYTFTYGWIGVLFIIMIKEIHDFKMRQVFKNIVVTLFAALIFILTLFILYVLFLQVYHFVSAIFGEVVYRIVGSI